VARVIHCCVPFRPKLIQSTEAMKCLLDSMLVLTKQDRLCHVIHATSDPFYQTCLRQLNVMQHCKVRTTPAFRQHTVIRALFRSLRSETAPNTRHGHFSARGCCLAFLNGSARHWILSSFILLLEVNWHTGKTISRIIVRLTTEFVHLQADDIIFCFPVNSNGALGCA
jgi:hypothetical protein